MAFKRCSDTELKHNLAPDFDTVEWMVALKPGGGRDPKAFPGCGPPPGRVVVNLKGNGHPFERGNQNDNILI